MKVPTISRTAIEVDSSEVPMHGWFAAERGLQAFGIDLDRRSLVPTNAG